MAKLFAVIHENNELKLLQWPSSACFVREGNSFTDERFICIATNRDLKDGLYQHEMVEPDLYIKKSNIEIEAYNMIVKAFRE